MVSLITAPKAPLCHLLVPRCWERRCPVSWTFSWTLGISPAGARRSCSERVRKGGTDTKTVRLALVGLTPMVLTVGNTERWLKGMKAGFGLFGGRSGGEPFRSTCHLCGQCMEITRTQISCQPKEELSMSKTWPPLTEVTRRWSQLPGNSSV